MGHYPYIAGNAWAVMEKQPTYRFQFFIADFLSNDGRFWDLYII